MSQGESATPLGKVRGLGSAHHGGGHWLEERFTSVALVVLALWLIFSIIMLPVLDHATIKEWLGSAWGAIPMALLIIAAFIKARRAQVAVEIMFMRRRPHWTSLAINWRQLLASRWLLVLPRSVRPALHDRIRHRPCVRVVVLGAGDPASVRRWVRPKGIKTACVTKVSRPQPYRAAQAESRRRSAIWYGPLTWHYVTSTVKGGCSATRMRSNLCAEGRAVSSFSMPGPFAKPRQNYQRAFGGMTRWARACAADCAAADRTGPPSFHALQQS